MPPRSLRRGDKCPNPGAVHKGCSRPKALRFDSPLGGPSVFGTGQYSGNIMQGGIALQPQDYLLDGITPLSACIVYTGAATVAPDALTGAAVFSCRNLVGIGASASLSTSTNCKGLLGFVRGLTALRNGAHLHMDKLGKAGNFGDISPVNLVGTDLLLRLNRTALSRFVVHGEGGYGASRNGGNAGQGCDAPSCGPMQTGGGGSGSFNDQSGWWESWSGAGGKGGPCCGGASSASFSSSGAGHFGDDAGPYGGPGGNPPANAAYGGTAGQGDPPGTTTGGNYANVAPCAGGGLLMLFSSAFDNGAGCVMSADGAPGQAQLRYAGSAATGSGGTGGGCTVLVTKRGGYTNKGTVRASGGAGGYPSSSQRGGNGAPGSVNIFEV